MKIYRLKIAQRAITWGTAPPQPVQPAPNATVNSLLSRKMAFFWMVVFVLMRAYVAYCISLDARSNLGQPRCRAPGLDSCGSALSIHILYSTKSSSFHPSIRVFSTLFNLSYSTSMEGFLASLKMTENPKLKILSLGTCCCGLRLLWLLYRSSSNH